MTTELVISAADIAEHAVLAELIAELTTALGEGERAATNIPPRTLILRDSPFAAFGVLPAFSARRDVFMTKVAAFVDGHGVNALVVLISATTGKILASIDGAALTALKTAAVAGVVLAHCTAPGSPAVGLIGTGIQAAAVFQAIATVRGSAHVRAYSRDRRHVDRFIDWAGRWGGRTRVTAAASADAAVDGADIVVTATSSRTPVCSTAGFPPNVHVHCVGAHTPRSREVPHEFLSRATIIVEDIDTAVTEAGDVHRRALDLERMLAGPPLADTPTVFSSTGHGFIDLIAATYVFRAVRR
jgi:ornithine cyclodeaminase/alanine dehydrogenase-like protein (mu-crystallin family)